MKTEIAVICVTNKELTKSDYFRSFKTVLQAKRAARRVFQNYGQEELLTLHVKVTTEVEQFIVAALDSDGTWCNF